MVYQTCLMNSLHFWWRILPLSCHTRKLASGMRICRIENPDKYGNAWIWKYILLVTPHGLHRLESAPPAQPFIDMFSNIFNVLHFWFITIFPDTLLTHGVIQCVCPEVMIDCQTANSHSNTQYNVPVVIIVNETLNTYTWPYNIILTCIGILGREQWTQSQTYILTNEWLFHPHLSLLF